jgi:putative endonuclease
MPYYTYIVTNSLSTVLYIGVTNNLESRLLQHRRKETPGFTSKYNVNKLVFYETYDHVLDAIAREKQLKGWTRKKKAWLVETVNKEWSDLSTDWYQ